MYAKNAFILKPDAFRLQYSYDAERETEKKTDR